MKKLARVLGITLLALTLIISACTTSSTTTTTQPTTTTASQPDLNVDQGTLGPVNPQQGTVTVGPDVYTITSSTGLTFEGQACTLAELADLQASGATFDCTVVYDDEGNVAALNVFSPPPPASVRGTISDVNITDSTVTVQTASGDKVFDVDPSTGLLIGGNACSLDLINALLDAGGDLPCTVIYSTDEQGNAIYIDIANPPEGITQGTGTVSSVDVQKSTVTIETDKGPRTFEIDANTGAFLNGEVCSLLDLQNALNEGFNFPDCQVTYFTDELGNLVYIDISQTATAP